MSRTKTLMQKMNPANLLRKNKAPFSVSLMIRMNEQFALRPMEQINANLSDVGIELAYNGNGTECGLIFIDSVKSSRKDDTAIPIFDVNTARSFSVYIMPEPNFKYTVYNMQGQVTLTIQHVSGMDSSITQIMGSKNYYKIEGEIV